MYDPHDVSLLGELLEAADIQRRLSLLSDADPDTEALEQRFSQLRQEWNTSLINLVTDDIVSSIESRVCVLNGWASMKPPSNGDKIDWLRRLGLHYKLVPDQFPLLQPVGFPCEYLALALVLHRPRDPHRPSDPQHWSLLVLYLDVSMASLQAEGVIRFQHYDSIRNLNHDLAIETAQRFTGDFLVSPETIRRRGKVEDIVEVEDMPWTYQAKGSLECGFCVGVSVSMLCRYVASIISNVDSHVMPAQSIIATRESWNQYRTELYELTVERSKTLSVPHVRPNKSPISWARLHLQRGTRCMILNSVQDMVNNYLHLPVASFRDPTVETILAYDVQRNQIWCLYLHSGKLCIYQDSHADMGPETDILLRRLGTETRAPVYSFINGLQQHSAWAYRLMTYLAVGGARRPYLNLRQANALIQGLSRDKGTGISQYEYWIARPRQTPLSPIRIGRSLLHSPMSGIEENQTHRAVIVSLEPFHAFTMDIQRLFLHTRLKAIASSVGKESTIAFSVSSSTVLVILQKPLSFAIRSAAAYRLSLPTSLQAPDYRLVRLPWHNASWLVQELIDLAQETIPQ
jgi:hypothetical protein